MYLPGHGEAFYKHDYDAIFADIANRSPAERKKTYRYLCENDLFFLLCFGLQRFDSNKPFVVQMCQEVESGPESDTLDLWAREHYKSTVITFARIIQRILKNPNIRIGIFSHTRPIAKGFLRQIKQALEQDTPIKSWFPEMFWANPERQAIKWSEDDGIQVIRDSTAKEATVEAWGVVKGQPTSRHFDLMVFDDVVTVESVTSPEMIAKTSEAMQIAASLGTDGGHIWYVGTHYHFADYWMELRESMRADQLRIRPATDDGTPEGNLVLLTTERWAQLKEKQGAYVLSCQQFLNPIDPTKQTLRWDWIRFYEDLPDRPLMVFLIVDPAHSKKKNSDNTAMGVIGVDVETWDRYLLDGCYEKLDLHERWSMLRHLCEMWPVKRIGYERYGLQSDIEHYEEMQRKDATFLPPIIELGGAAAKEDRIRRLVPIIKNGKFFIPQYGLTRNGVDIQAAFKLELETFPFAKHDDFIDMLSRQMDEDMMIQGEPVFRESTIANLKKGVGEITSRYRIDEMYQFVSDQRGEMKVWAEPMPGATYIVGVYPKHMANSMAAIQVIAQASGKQVAVWRGSVEAEVLAVIAIAIAMRYRQAWLVPETERNELLMQSIFARKYGRVFCEAEVIPPNKPRPRYGFRLNAATLPALVQQLREETTNGSHGLNDEGTIEELRAIRQIDGRDIVIESGFSRERILARLLAGYARRVLPAPINAVSQSIATQVAGQQRNSSWEAFT